MIWRLSMNNLYIKRTSPEKKKTKNRTSTSHQMPQSGEISLNLKKSSLQMKS